MTANLESDAGPLAGLRVVEFAHMVMGPTCGMILGDLGAEVIKVEPVGGDNTRRLPGSGSGFFAMFNRNKKSLALDVADPRGREVLERLVGTADVFTENFKDGTMAKLGLDHASLARHNERLIYVSLKGFLPGPYESRTALDEVVQMMGGLAYMTGPEGRPLRAGTAVNDIMGGLFGALGALAALRERDRTGRGRHVQSALFENNVFLMGMHMMQYAVTGKPPAPMPGRIAAWAVYDVFEVKDGAQIFLAVVSDTQWAIFCDAFGYADLKADARLATNAERVAARAWLMPLLRERLAARDAAEIARIFDAHQLPYAPIVRPHELFDDPHLVASGGLADVEIPADGSRAGRPIRTRTPLLPIAVDGRRFALRRSPPALGEHTRELLRDLGYTDDAVSALALAGVVRDAHARAATP